MMMAKYIVIKFDSSMKVLTLRALNRVAPVARWGLFCAAAVVYLRSYVMAEGPQMQAGLHSIAYVTVPSNDVGKTLARKIVENKLAACVNVIPQITSVYEWKGEINEDSEALLMIKTRTSRIDDLTKFVKDNHPYEVCEVISTIIDNGNLPYLKWISDTVPEIK